MIRFAADENFGGAILRGLQAARPDIDVVRVQDTEMSGTKDPELLEWTATQKRILLTHDVNTMPGFAYDRVKTGLPMPGVFVVNTDFTIGVIIEQIILLVECSTEDEWEGQVALYPVLTWAGQCPAINRRASVARCS